MEIYQEKKRDLQRFKDVEPGTCFLNEAGDICIKTKMLRELRDQSFGVTLEEGEFWEFEDEELVECLKVKGVVYED